MERERERVDSIHGKLCGGWLAGLVSTFSYFCAYLFTGGQNKARLLRRSIRSTTLGYHNAKAIYRSIVKRP